MQDSNVANTGVKVEVLADSGAEKLAGRTVSSLNKTEFDLLKESLVDREKIFFRWSNELNKVAFNKSNINYWISEYSPVMSGLSRYFPGVRPFSVFHDRWMATWDIKNLGILIGTIPPAAAAQYYALGVGNYHYYKNNLEE